MELPTEITEGLMVHWPVARLASRTPEGRPHQIPVVYARHAGHLWSPIDHKPKHAGELARERNIRAHPGVSLLLDHYVADWERLWWIRVDGQAAVVEESPGDLAFPLAALALQAKYPQYERLALFHGRPRLLRIVVQAVRSWSAGPAALDAASQWLRDRNDGGHGEGSPDSGIGGGAAS